MKENLNHSIHLNHNETYIVAVSGGVDSMVLLHLLHESHYKIVVCYVNHDIRPETYLDENLVEKTCKEMNVPLEKIKLTYSEKEKKENFQETARKKRYAFFQETAEKYHTQYIITAHHGDDNIETILMKISRGSNLYGYSGIHSSVKIGDFIYLRPLLGFSKEEIKEYASKENIPYLEDHSNSEDHYQRNKIRHHVIPTLREYYGSIEERFLSFSTQLAEAFDFIRATTLSFVGDSQKISLSQYFELPIVIQKDVLNYLFETHEILSSKEKIENALSFLNNKNSNGILSIGNGYNLVKSYDFFEILPIPKNTSYQAFVLTDYQEQTIETSSVRIHVSKEKPLEKCLYLSKDMFPITIRNRKDGDKMTFSFGTKKVKDILINAKINRSLRDKLYLVEDKNGNILYISTINKYSTHGQINPDTLYLSIQLK